MVFCIPSNLRDGWSDNQNATSDVHSVDMLQGLACLLTVGMLGIEVTVALRRLDSQQKLESRRE